MLEMKSFFKLLALLCLALTRVDGFANRHARPAQPQRSLCLQKSTSSNNPVWETHVSVDPDYSVALEKILKPILSSSPPPDLAFLFVGGSEFGASFTDIVQEAAHQLKGTRLLSVKGGGVVGNAEYDEPSKPSIAILAGRLPPGSEMQLFSFNERSNPPPGPDSEYWTKIREAATSCILFADPWSPVQHVLESLGTSAVVVGGISVPTSVNPTVAIDGKCLPQGSLVGLTLEGSLRIQAIVAQGCRPVGIVYTVTKCEKNCITELDGEPAIGVLQKLVSDAPTEEQRRISSGLVCGIAKSGQAEDGDFLIRQIAGFLKGGIVVGGGSLEVGDLFRFHVQEGDAAKEDMDLMMKRAETERLFHQQGNEGGGTTIAALQISCIARGRGLFGEADVDISRVKTLVSDDAPIGGFYANGEIGPVGVAGFASTPSGCNTYLHAFTTVVAMFCDYSASIADENETEIIEDEPVDAWG